MMKSMAVLVLLAVVLTGAKSLSKEEEMASLEMRETCARELQLSAEDAAKVKSGDFTNVGNGNIKCMVKCIFEKSGLLANGEYNLPNIQKAFADTGSPEQIAAKVDQCKSFNGEQCENINKCGELLHKPQ